MAWFVLKNHCTFSPERGGGFLEIYCSDEKLSEQLRLKNIQEKYCYADRQITYCHISQSGMMSLLSDWITRKQANTSSICSQLKTTCASVEDFPARTCQSVERRKDLMENVPDFGLRCTELLARYDQEKSLWKTHQCLLFEDSTELLETFPKSGMTVDGQLWELMMSKHPSKGRESGLSDIEDQNEGGYSLKYPTPVVHDEKGCQNPHILVRKDGKSRMDQLANFVVYGDFDKKLKQWRTPTTITGGKSSEERLNQLGAGNWERSSGQKIQLRLIDQVRDSRLYPPDSKAETIKPNCELNPDWTEWLMGWPIGWTSLKPLSKEEFMKWFEEVLSNKWWDKDPADEGVLSRVTECKINRSKRIKALGNGQVPLCVCTATCNLSRIKEASDAT